MPKKIILIEKWVLKYGEISGIDKDVMMKLFRDDMLKPSGMKAALIKHDAEQLQKKSGLSKTQIKTLLADDYSVTFSHIETILYNKNNFSEKQYRCLKCGVKITQNKDKKNNGLCDICLIKEEGVEL